ESTVSAPRPTARRSGARSASTSRRTCRCSRSTRSSRSAIAFARDEARMNWRDVTAQLFPQGHDIAEDGELIAGTGRSGDVAFAVIGSTHHAEIGVELAL